MRTRLTKDQRRSAILDHAGKLLAARGYAALEMEDIRRACDISRGGLYHHFANKRAILDALVAQEVTALASLLDAPNTAGLSALLEAGSRHLRPDHDAPRDVLAALTTPEEKRDYISALTQAFETILRPVLATHLRDVVRPEVNPDHAAELFLTLNAHINRREILGGHAREDATDFAALALAAFAPLLKAPDGLTEAIEQLKAQK